MGARGARRERTHTNAMLYSKVKARYKEENEKIIAKKFAY